eukprot:2060609-Amphidinium_carterae.1
MSSSNSKKSSLAVAGDCVSFMQLLEPHMFLGSQRCVLEAKPKKAGVSFQLQECAQHLAKSFPQSSCYIPTRLRGDSPERVSSALKFTSPCEKLKRQTHKL